MPSSAGSTTSPRADTHRIIIQPEAYEGLESGYDFIGQYAPESAQQWAVGLLDTVNSLATFPGRCPLAPEDRFFPQEIRQLLFGTGRSTYRMLFTITEDTVSVLHLRHGAQDTLRPEE